jgi:hypothetical protein
MAAGIPETPQSRIAEEARQILDVEHAVYARTEAVIDAMAAEYVDGYTTEIGPMDADSEHTAAVQVADAYLVLIHAKVCGGAA